MRFEKLEKSIIKIDKELEALTIAKKYLSNIDEINEVKDTLNKERQILADELYYGDKKAYTKCCEIIEGLLDKELDKYEQMDLLEDIKKIFGRKSPNVSKRTNGLNAWLKELCIEYKWIENENSDWATLIVTGFGLYE
ncbi:hypothetical protein SAMN02745163_01668 [Clostridium cavendishii DSM 21758]|uniref:Uncharacterized protein n=1 Tax=Clostridium cavendishii DSM 21758 TaxID=1121302 RepID=A0A1M6I259_9CLOT|nr:hypothetical protein [Clostridium cavendishii]SHJ28559.1 hypothetical protein SAMN02745163_01668 [Clostridium cavendishii DSM 21758]